MIITIKNADGTARRMHDLVALAKGLIGPTDLANGGQMTPQAAAKLILMLFEDDFLKKVTTETMSRLTKAIDVADLLRRQLVRVAQGNDPEEADMTDVAEHGCKLTALDLQLFPTLTLDYLRENKDNPQLMATVEGGFNTRMQNDLVDLAFNGVADDATGANREAKFLRLNKGWLQVLRESTKAPKVDIDPATDGWEETLAKVYDASDARFRRDAVFVMNEGDADAYARQLGAAITGTPLRADSPLRRFEGKTIEAHPDMPAGSVMFTPLKNLVFGVHTDIRRDRSYHSRKRALEYTFDMAVDFEVAVKQAAVLGEPD